MFYITLLSGELSVEKYSATIKTDIILLIVYQSDLLPKIQTACYAQMVSTIYDIEEIYSKGRRKVQVYAKDLLCYWAVRELGECPLPVIPAKAEIYNYLRILDSRFHGNDNLDYFWQNSKISKSF